MLTGNQIFFTYNFFLLQETFRRVFPRVWRTLFVQIAMAALSLAAGPRLEPDRKLTVFRTAFTHPQNFFVLDFEASIIYYLPPIFYPQHSDGVKPPHAHARRYARH
jgi:hypothetical protein